MTNFEYTSESSQAANWANGFFLDWQSELQDGALRQHVQRLASAFRDLSLDELRLVVGSIEGQRLCMFGAWKVDGRNEIVGPYVHPDYRRSQIGSTTFRGALRQAWAETDTHHYVPVGMEWLLPKLEECGLERITPVLADGLGDHYAFHASMPRTASVFLRKMQEPRGSGAWVVLLHNDDTTPYDFVIEALVQAIDVNHDIAHEYANLVHSTGTTPIRYCRTEWGAKRLVARIDAMAKTAGCPLRSTYESRR